MAWANPGVEVPMSLFARLMTAATLIMTALATPALALDGADGYVFVPNRASADVAVIDTRTDQVIARLPVGNVPHQVAVSDVTGKVVASNTADDTISVVDLGTLATTTLKLDHEPEHMALAPDGVLLAVGNIAAGTVSLVSLATEREVARVDGLFDPHNLTFSPDGLLLYVANLGASHVSVIDVASAAIVDEIEVAEPPALAGKEDPGAGFHGIINVTSTPDGRLGFAAHGEASELAVIDLRTRELKKRVTLGELPWRAYSTADGRFMLVPNNGDRTLSVISTSTLELVATLPAAEDVTGVNTGWFETTAFALSRAEKKAVVYDLESMTRAGEIAFPGTPETGVTTPDGSKLYVALSDTDRVAVIDIQKRELTKIIDGVGDEPWGTMMTGTLNYCH
jgi:YVTN family beta-propeller protein